MLKNQRIKLRRGTADTLQTSKEVLLDGELVLINSKGQGYDSLIIGNGKTAIKDLEVIPLHVKPGSVFLGPANPDTIPGRPLQDCFYLATRPGDYTRFGLQVEPGEVAFLRWQNIGWSKVSVRLIQVDSELSEESENPVQNKAITQELRRLENLIPQVDEELSGESRNPVQNRAVTHKIEEINDWYVG